MNTYEINVYGTVDTNPVEQGHHEIERERICVTQMIALAKGNKVTSDRLRLVSDPGYPYWDISYWHIDINGTKYEIGSIQSFFGDEDLTKKGYKSQIYNACKDNGIFIHNMFNSISTCC